jgi:hypothetical protein
MQGEDGCVALRRCVAAGAPERQRGAKGVESAAGKNSGNRAAVPTSLFQRGVTGQGRGRGARALSEKPAKHNEAAGARAWAQTLTPDEACSSPSSATKAMLSGKESYLHQRRWRWVGLRAGEDPLCTGIVRSPYEVKCLSVLRPCRASEQGAATLSSPVPCGAGRSYPGMPFSTHVRVGPGCLCQCSPAPRAGRERRSRGSALYALGRMGMYRRGGTGGGVRQCLRRTGVWSRAPRQREGRRGVRGDIRGRQGPHRSTRNVRWLIAAWRSAGKPAGPKKAGTSGGRAVRMRAVKSARDATLETTMQSGELEVHGRPESRY